MGLIMQRQGRWMPILLLLVMAAFLLPGLGRQIMGREQELRVTLTARTMVESGDWLRPEYLGEPRLRKPPLMYWVVAAAYRIADTTTSTTVARLPSAFIGVALVLLLYGLTARESDRRRDFVSALVCGTSFIFLKQAKLAETDILLCLGTSLATLALFKALSGRSSGWWWMAGLGAGLGFMAKGPAALVLPLLAAITYSATTPVARPSWRSWGPVGALLLFLVLILPWYLFILTDHTASRQVQDELQRVAATSEHPGPWFYYLYTLLHAQAPWSLLLPFALIAAWRQRGDPLQRFALSWLGSSLLVLSLISSKQIHYALLLIPPAALVTGGFLADEKRWRRTKTFGIPLFALLLVINIVLTAVVMPAKGKGRVIQEVMAMAPDELARAGRVLFSGTRNSIAEFYAGRRLELVPDVRRAWETAAKGDVVVVVTEGKPPPEPELPAPARYQQSSERMRCYLLIK